MSWIIVREEVEADQALLAPDPPFELRQTFLTGFTTVVSGWAHAEPRFAPVWGENPAQAVVFRTAEAADVFARAIELVIVRSYKLRGGDIYGWTAKPLVVLEQLAQDFPRHTGPYLVARDLLAESEGTPAREYVLRQVLPGGLVREENRYGAFYVGTVGALINGEPRHEVLWTKAAFRATRFRDRPNAQRIADEIGAAVVEVR